MKDMKLITLLVLPQLLMDFESSHHENFNL